MAQAKPQVIDDEEHERVYERVAAVDVAKDSGMVCTRTPHRSRPGARQSTVWTVKARMTAIRALGRQLKRDGIEMVTLESTSDYWRIWLRREAPCCIPGLAGRNLEDIPGSDPNPRVGR
jgi:transposase